MQRVRGSDVRIVAWTIFGVRHRLNDRIKLGLRLRQKVPAASQLIRFVGRFLWTDLGAGCHHPVPFQRVHNAYVGGDALLRTEMRAGGEIRVSAYIATASWHIPLRIKVG